MKVLYSEYHYRHRECWKEYPKSIFKSCLISTYMYLISHIGLLMKHKPFLIEFVFFQLIFFYSFTSQDPVHELHVSASLCLCLLLMSSIFSPKTLKAGNLSIYLGCSGKKMWYDNGCQRLIQQATVKMAPSYKINSISDVFLFSSKIYHKIGHLLKYS